MSQKSLKLMVWLLSLALLVLGCNKDDSSSTGPALESESTFTFTLNGTNYSGQASAVRNGSLITVSTRVTPQTGPVNLVVAIDTSSIVVNTPLDLKSPSRYAYVMFGDTASSGSDHLYQSWIDGSGTLTVTKWTGKEIAGTLSFDGSTGSPAHSVCSVKNGTFKVSSIVVVP
jgi:hypothetical protein